MGWNDRLPEDPYWPDSEYYQARDAYEEWLAYIASQVETAEAELAAQPNDLRAAVQATDVVRMLSSQNLTPEDLVRLTNILDSRKEAIAHENDTDSRQPARNQTEQEARDQNPAANS